MGPKVSTTITKNQEEQIQKRNWLGTETDVKKKTYLKQMDEYNDGKCIKESTFEYNEQYRPNSEQSVDKKRHWWNWMGQSSGTDKNDDKHKNDHDKSKNDDDKSKSVKEESGKGKKDKSKTKSSSNKDAKSKNVDGKSKVASNKSKGLDGKEKKK